MARTCSPTHRVLDGEHTVAVWVLVKQGLCHSRHNLALGCLHCCHLDGITKHKPRTLTRSMNASYCGRLQAGAWLSANLGSNVQSTGSKY